MEDLLSLKKWLEIEMEKDRAIKGKPTCHPIYRAVYQEVNDMISKKSAHQSNASRTSRGNRATYFHGYNSEYDIYNPDTVKKLIEDVDKILADISSIKKSIHKIESSKIKVKIH